MFIDHDEGMLTLLLVLISLSIGIFLFSIVREYLLFESIDRGYSFWVIANKEGIILYNEAGEQLPIKKWEEYLYYVEHDDYLAIYEENALSFLPKSDKLSALLALTKNYIKEKK